MRCATFVLSTGRCGTQWLAQAFRAIYGDMVCVEHEPLHNRYESRRMLGANSLAGLPPARARKIAQHVERIERELAVRDYFETGHPAWGCLPYLRQHFAGRLRIVHLVRHPVPTACSWLTHGAYVPPLLPHLPAKEFVTPFDPGVAFPEYQAGWTALSSWEKCLYYWAEVNALGLRLSTTPDTLWLRLRYEEMFSRVGLDGLVAFLGLPPREGLRGEAERRIDRFHSVAVEWMDPTRLTRHPRVLEVAARLGYEAHDFDETALRARYFGR